MTDIIDRIDDVLTDWHGSADAMHWTADPHLGINPPLFEQRIQEIVRSWAPALSRLAEAVRLAWGQVAIGLAALGRHLQAVAPRRKGYQHQPMPQFARPRALPIDGRAYHHRRRAR
jgi:hypothetical protein